MALFPRRTLWVLICLILIILILGFARYKATSAPQPPNDAPPAGASPTPSLPVPSLTPIASASAQIATQSAFPRETPARQSPLGGASPAPSPTPLPINPQTGWHQYRHPTQNFAFDFPSTWTLQAYKPGTQPLVAVAAAVGEQPLGFMVSDAAWASSDLGNASPSGQFTYQNWTGQIYRQTQDGVTTTIVTATQSTPQGNTLKISWLYPSLNGGIDTFLKPILNTFKFSSTTPNLISPTIKP